MVLLELEQHQLCEPDLQIGKFEEKKTGIPREKKQAQK